jgi:hypothetical protein
MREKGAFVAVTRENRFSLLVICSPSLIRESSE